MKLVYNATYTQVQALRPKFMTLMPINSETALSSSIETYEEAKSLHSNMVWQKLNDITIHEAIALWLSTLSFRTHANYQSGMNRLVALGLIDPLMNLQAFALVNHEAIVDKIKLVQGWSECTRQARAACYISFTGFLSRRLQGIMKKAIPSREGSAKTFYRVYEKVQTSAMTQVQWIGFFQALDKINIRDCLIAKVILQGGKRVNEALSIQTHHIDWEQREIAFIQSKMKGMLKTTVITYPESIMNRLRQYIGDRKGHVFVTRSGKPVLINQLAVTFSKAGQEAGIPFKVSPHVLRASTVTYLKQQGFSDSDIMRVTGHASAEMVYAYDKTARADNASKKVSLVV